jgi:NAD(P)-dependent dehydrogenase (short-subunit alcohol dehydrogenase family)
MTTMEATSQIDIVVANAGLQTALFWEDTFDTNGELTEPNWKVIDTNLKGIMATVRLALHYFKKNKVPGGRCIIVGSPDGYLRGSKLTGPIAEYIATEHGVSLCRCISLTSDHWLFKSCITYLSQPLFTDICGSSMVYENNILF